jgi:hypothetical protein
MVANTSHKDFLVSRGDPEKSSLLDVEAPRPCHGGHGGNKEEYNRYSELIRGNNRR